MHSMNSTSDPLEILINEGGGGEVTLAVERDQRHQDSQVVNRQGREPDPWPRELTAQRAVIFVTLIGRLHGFSSLESGWDPGVGSERRTASIPRLAGGAGAGSSGRTAIASWTK